MNILGHRVTELEAMKTYPKELFYSGNLSLLEKEKISIVGTRRPSKYAKDTTQKIANELAKRDVCIVSGGAMGVDAVAHKSAGACNTIAVLPCGINIKYPSINKNLLQDIENQGLLLSQFEPDFKSRAWSFVVRNELVVALGKVLIVGEADIGSGSMRSVEFAHAMGKEIYVLPHRLGESKATNLLVKEGKAQMIYDIDEFVMQFGKSNAKAATSHKDEFIVFCDTNPTYDEVLAKYPSRVFEAELEGIIEIVNARVYVKL